MELQRQESKELKSGSPFQVALQSPKIAVSSQEDISKVLRYVMVKLGLRAANWPNEFEKEILMKHIAENFARHTVAEIRLAFDKAIMGELDVDSNCYENFSCIYFTNIMLAYRQWANRQIMFESMTKERPKTDEEILQINLQYCYCKLKEISKLPFLNIAKAKR